MGAEQIRSLARSGKEAGPLPVNTGFPVVIDIAVAFAAEAVALVIVNEFPIVEPQFITVFVVVAVETPPHGFSMMEHDILVGLL